MVVLKNEKAVLKINERGAEMKSFTVDSVEYLWVGDPNFWAASAPHLFPIAGGLKDDKYILDGKEYILPKHGFAKGMDFAVESVSDTRAIFLLTASRMFSKSFLYINFIKRQPKSFRFRMERSRICWIGVYTWK